MNYQLVVFPVLLLRWKGVVKKKKKNTRLLSLKHSKAWGPDDPWGDNAASAVQSASQLSADSELSFQHRSFTHGHKNDRHEKHWKVFVRGIKWFNTKKKKHEGMFLGCLYLSLFMKILLIHFLPFVELFPGSKSWALFFSVYFHSKLLKPHWSVRFEEGEHGSELHTQTSRKLYQPHKAAETYLQRRENFFHPSFAMKGRFFKKQTQMN